MTELEAREKLIGLKEQVSTVISTGEAESRELSETETNTLAELRQQIADVEAELANIEAENRKLANENKNNNNETKTHKRMKLVDLINAVANNTVSDEMRQYVEGNKITLRANDPGAVVAGQATYGQENVPEDKMALDVAIRNASVLTRMGATWFPNAVGDLSLPHMSSTQVGWKGEIEAADDGKGEFSEVILTPHRLTAFVDISKQFLLQDRNNAESLIINDLAAAVAQKFDETVFSDTTGSTQPAGLFSAEYDIAASGNTLSGITYDNFLQHELTVEQNNGTNFLWICNPDVFYAAKGTQMASGLRMVAEGNEIDGYPAIRSNSVISGGLICMDPRDLAVASWNGVDIVVDTTSQALKGCIRLVVNYYVDAKLRGNRISAEIFE